MKAAKSIFNYISVTCGKCETELKLNEEAISSSSTPCDLCGSHGEIIISDICSNCKTVIDIEVASW